MRLLRDLMSRNLGIITRGGHNGGGHDGGHGGSKHGGSKHGGGGHGNKHGSAYIHRGYDDFSHEKRPQPNLKQCKNCNNQLDASALFCDQCGSSQTPKLCTNCKTPLQAGNRFCSQCGQEA